ncbi:hypothetical protein Slin15195_G016220 [Septoria linicola]|uniref:Uncharacterized protein n=1 Tax=Septoria linicola TaxID=215465 RepID=A0A9Q9EGI4_9PEZI|nr:hypothetical protein Slin14017_G016280 [Septoria linicola]USW48303.1 hypothetical protein Slin15195_G016220 [Septoria linicola]
MALRADTQENADAPMQEQPELPPRQYQTDNNARPRTPQGLNGQPVPDTSHLALPPQRLSQLEAQSQPSAIDYTRDLRRLTGYLIPYPKPHLPDVPPENVPQRFLIYTPPAPPFYYKPVDGKREGITQWTKRHWYKELREAKMRDPPKGGKATRWKRFKWRGTKATNWGINKVKSSNLEFLNRVAGLQDQSNNLAEDIYSKTISPEEILLVYPPGLNLSPEPSSSRSPSPDQSPTHSLLRQAFLHSLQCTKRAAYKDTLISTLLFPPALIIDTLAVPIWPLGGLAEIDAVWIYTSIRGAKTSRSITKRLTSGDLTDKKAAKKLELSFVESQRMEVLEQYLAAKCHEVDPVVFPVYVNCPGETQVLEAIGWSHSDQHRQQDAVSLTGQAEGTMAGGGGAGGAGGLAAKAMTWDDEQWEITQVKDDLKDTFGKGAKEWVKWTKLWRKKPKEAAKR